MPTASITDFQDYRDFLKARFEEEKRAWDGFSFQYCATKLGSAKSFLKLVIEKKRHVSSAKVPLLWTLFKMGDFERQYFTFLHLSCISEDPHMKAYFQEILRRSRSLEAARDDGHVEAPTEQQSLFQHWVRMAIHSLGRFRDFSIEPAWIKARLVNGYAIPDGMVQKWVGELIEDKLLVPKEGGGYQAGEFVFRRPEEFDLDGHKIYRVAMSKAWEAAGEPAVHSPCQFYMLSIGLDEESRKQAIQMTTDHRDRLIALARACQDKKAVVMVSSSLFTVAEAKA